MTQNEQEMQERNANLLKLQPTIKKAAKSVAYIWNNILDAEDAEQTITLHLLERTGSLKKITGMERDAQYRAVVGIGHQLASQERSDYDHFKGSYRYSLKEVKDALQAGVLVEEFDHFHEVVFDIREALKVLESRSPKYAEAIRKRYEDYEVPTENLEQQRLKNALPALTDEMNKANKRRFANRIDGPGTRKAVSNLKAQFLTQYYEEGRYGLVHDENRSQRTNR